jgi:hypothetical protein
MWGKHSGWADQIAILPPKVPPEALWLPVRWQSQTTPELRFRTTPPLSRGAAGLFPPWETSEGGHRSGIEKRF